MKRRTKYSLIIVLAVILGLGFGVYKIFFVPAEPLKIKNLEKATTTIRTANNNGYPLGDESWAIQIWQSQAPGKSFGLIRLDNNQEWFEDGEAYMNTEISVYLVGETFPLDIEAGKTVTLTYDGGQNLIIYLPEIKDLGGSEDITLYPATDGSTYYNRRLTRRAYPAPRP